MINGKNYIKALTIKERIEALSNYKKEYIDFEKYEKWINIRGVVHEADILKYYNELNITPEEIAKVISLDEPEEQKKLADCLVCKEWFNTFKSIIDKYNEKNEVICFDDENIDLGMFVFPFVIYIGDKVEERIKRVDKFNITRHAFEKILEKSTNVLVNLGIKTFVWDFRSNSVSIKQGEKQNFDKENILIKEYLKEFKNVETIIKFYEKYPVVLRRIIVKTNELIDNYILLIDRIEQDFIEIEKILDDKIIKLTDINSDQGDTHEGGQFVIKLTFNCGDIIYKPRNLMIQKKFYDFIEELSDKDEGILDMPKLKTSYHEKYTWDGFVEYKDCEKIEEVSRYYVRFGQMCAYVYLLRGNDIHYENIIASGEYPIIIDVETLFQNLSDSVQYQEDAASIVYKECIDSVGGTAMIPIMAFSKGNGEKGIDISALGGKGCELPNKYLQLVDATNDGIHFEEKNVMINDALNLPRYKSKIVDFHNYINEIIMGFKKVMEYVEKNKKEVIEKISKSFANVEIRHLMRATQNYAKMLDFSSHPNYSEDIAMLEKLMINVWAYPYKNKKIIKYEIADLIFGDIPIFFGKINSTSIFSSNRNIIEGYFEKTPFEKVKERIDKLSIREIQKQISQMKICMGMYVEENISKKIIQKSRRIDCCNSKILENVEMLADKIIETAVIHKQSRTVDWNNVFYDSINNCWKTRGISTGLISGLPGVLIFIYLANKNVNKYNEFIDIACNTMINMPCERLPINLADGISSNLYITLLLYIDTKKEKFKNELYYYLGIIKKKLNTTKDVSMLYGLSGVGIVIAEVFEELKDPYIADILNEIKDILVRTDTSELDNSFYNGKRGYNYCLNIIKSILSDCEKEDCIDIENLEFGLSDDIIFNKIVNKKNDYLSFAGSLGELLYKTILKDGKDSLRTKEICSIIMENLSKGNMYFTSIEGYEAVGFMYGMAGIGYTLLRAVEDEIYDIPLISKWKR